LGEALINPRVLGLSLVYFGIQSGVYGLVYWLPQIVKGMATDIGLDKAVHAVHTADDLALVVIVGPACPVAPYDAA
jgi:hypothetical protein